MPTALGAWRHHDLDLRGQLRLRARCPLLGLLGLARDWEVQWRADSHDPALPAPTLPSTPAQDEQNAQQRWYPLTSTHGTRRAVLAAAALELDYAMAPTEA